MRFGLPYKVVGGTRFYDRREIKDAMAYVRAIANPADEVSVKRVLGVPKRGIGESSVAKLDALAAGMGSTSSRRCATQPKPVSPGQRHAASSRSCGCSTISLRRVDDGPGDLLQAALTESGYLAELEAEGSVEAAGRIENLGELVGSAREFTRLDEFLEQVSLVADTDDLDDDNQVVLMTLHSAKGLEFPAVFLVGRRRGFPPHPFARPNRTSWKRNAASPTSASPVPSDGCSSPTPGAAALRHHQLQPAVAVRSTRSRPR